MTKIHKFVSLKDLHTFKLPYQADAVVELTAAEDLPSLADNYYVLGEGSNTIFTTDFSRTVLKVGIKGYECSETENSFELRVGAGENWHDLVIKTLDADMPGLENLALIPGSVGAAPVQNIGAYGVEVSEFIRTVEAWDREQHEFVMFSQKQCCFAYRDSLFKQHAGRYVITHVNFSLSKNWRAQLSYGALSSVPGDASAKTIMKAVVAIRNSKLPNPKVLPNAGSFFKNPVIPRQQLQGLLERFPDMPYYPVDDMQVKVAAGWLIDQLGLKGFSCGGVSVHDKQALVLVNKGEASGEELLTLAKEITSRVKTRFAIELEIEVRIMGEKELINA